MILSPVFRLLVLSSLSIAFVTNSIANDDLTPDEKDQRYELGLSTAISHIVVKFKDGTGVRMRNGMLLKTSKFNTTGISIALLSKESIDVEKIANNSGHVVQRLFKETEAELDDLKISGEANTNKNLKDLNLYYTIPVDAGSTFADVQATVKKLNALKSIEIAYAMPVSKLAGLPLLSKAAVVVNPNFENLQGYLGAPPNGINARAAWSIAGARGTGVQIIDLEGDWNLTHEDLPSVIADVGIHANYPGIDYRNHGTAVLGVLAAKDNGVGVTGIVSNASIGVYSHELNGAPAAIIRSTANNLGRGDILLIEMQIPGPVTNPNCRYAPTSENCKLIPIEWYQAVFDAISILTANDVIVVEAAGNGGVNLDDPAFNNAFNLSSTDPVNPGRDSGAIIVGASESISSTAMYFSTYGSRVDVHGWGENVTTTGYSDLSVGNSENQWYTSTFAGTSSASSIVAGATASIQGVRFALGLTPLNSIGMRNLLKTSGTAQLGNTKNIGPLPDIFSAINTFSGILPPINGKTTDLTVNISLDTSTPDWYLFNVSVTNNGPDQATAVVSSNPVSGLFVDKTYLVNVNPVNSCMLLSGKVINCNFGAVNSGSTVSMSYWAYIPQSSVNFTNTVTVTGNENDPISNNSSTVVK